MPSRAPWILGGLAAVNVLVLIVGATLFFVNHQSSGAGPYTTAGVDNACDLVDPTPLDRWEDQREKVENEEVERKNRTADGLECRIVNRNGDDEVELTVIAVLNSRDMRDDYEWMLSRARSDRAGDALTEVSDLGERAHALPDPQHCYKPAEGTCLDYWLRLLDGNLHVSVTLNVALGGGRVVNNTEVADIARIYAERMMIQLRK